MSISKPTWWEYLFGGGRMRISTDRGRTWHEVRTYPVWWGLLKEKLRPKWKQVGR